MNKKIKRIYTFTDNMEAERIKAILKKKNIHSIIRSFHDSAFSSIYIKQYGEGELLVLEKDFPKAMKILSVYNNAIGTFSEPKDISFNHWYNSQIKKKMNAAIIIPIIFSIIPMIAGIFFLNFSQLSAKVCGIFLLFFAIFAIIISYLNWKAKK
jgi:hypothetical protein